MRLRLTLVLLLIIVTNMVKAQVYGNTWINYSQQYFKFPISREGIYRIDSTTLSNYFNLSVVNPKNFQLFIKGKEQFIYINGENDNQLNTGDYLEFYANPNVREVDSLLYTNISYHPSPYLSFFNDTLYGFITLNNSTANKRYQLETDTNSVLYPSADHFYSEKIYSLYNYYNGAAEYAYELGDPRYTQAEGHGQRFNKGGTISKTFSSLNTYTNSGLPSLFKVSYAGNSLDVISNAKDHLINLAYTDQSNTNIVLNDSNFRGFVPVNLTFTLNTATLGNNPTFNITSVAAPSLSAIDANDLRTTLYYFSLFYPQNLDLAGVSTYKLFMDDPGSSAKGFYDFSNFNTAGSSEIVMFDLTNSKKITTKISGTNVRAVIPNSNSRKLCFISAEPQIININSLIKVNQTGSFTNFKNFTGNKPYVIIYNKKFKTGSTQYANYRQSIAGGSYNVIMADVDELYEQFIYGINQHPLAIRHFLRFLYDSLPEKPLYAFLIGKGVRQENLSSLTYTDNYVPTMGAPSSDNLLASGLDIANLNTTLQDIPIGRIAATSNADIIKYLTKVQQHESSGPAEWKKKVLHFVGGDQPDLTSLLSTYMLNYEQIISDTLFGGTVYTYKKNTTAPIQVNISDSIKSTISNGAAIINFFGHGSEQGFDQAIDDPEQFNNAGKYPFVIANSCQSGGIHTPGRISVSERFVFADQKGSIGFVSTTTVGLVSSLNSYCNQLYIALSKTKYNQGIGDIIKETCRINSSVYDSITKFTAMDMTLHGDPAVKISNGALPDYLIKNTSVSFDTKKYADSLGINIKITNLGKAVADSFMVKVERSFPNGDSTTIYKRIKAPLFKDSLAFYMLIDFNRGVGLNKFRVVVDEFNEIGESLENNNATLGTLDLFIAGGDIIPVYPYKYAIVPKTSTITLKASTTDPFAPLTTYRFELDTCDKFTQPIQTTFITSKGGVIEWNVNLPFGDSTVYFWRVSHDSISPTTTFAWRESSFQTVGSKRGWGQAHFHQFKNDAYQFVSYKKPLRKFVFENSKNSIYCRNGIYPYIYPTNITFYFNNINLSSWGCAPDGWNFAVFDSVTGQPETVVSTNWPSSGLGQYKNCVCVSNQILYVYSFGELNYCQSPNWKGDMVDFLNGIPSGKYVLAYTVDQTTAGSHITQYSKAMYNAFESIGAKTIRNTPDTVPYILFGRKGMVAGQGNEVKGTYRAETITLTDSITTRWNNGFIASEIIGPSFKWNSLHWRVQSTDAGPGDTTTLKVLGIKANGQTDTLLTLSQDSLDILNLSAYANAAIYPYMKLVAFMKDNISTTSPQLKRWQVLYDEAPECAINPLKGFKAINDTLQEGDKVRFVFPVENIGIKNFNDSLVLTYWVEDNSRNKVTLPQKLKPKPFVPGQVILDTVTVDSYLLTGNNFLWVFANPLGNSKYQIEQFQFNNIANYGFKVNRDITNPLLDVTFDGIRILNGDIVSAKPSILITLKDENQFLALNDTAAFTVFVQAPNQSTPQRIYFANGLQFTPANLPKNSCAINYYPNFSTDGVYTLLVQAKDRSNNRSGAQNYQIQFEVNNKPTVTNIVNYPNPFTTSTRFVFTLTGSEVPEVFTIQIMTISGKLVREITRSELGNIHIGRNITEYAWDGRDNFGDRLANGVYLYKVITKLNGENIEKAGSGADKFIVKEFGKMVIMR